MCKEKKKYNERNTIYNEIWKTVADSMKETQHYHHDFKYTDGQ